MANWMLMATFPHSGEMIPPEAHWLKGLDEVSLMGDVDRFVDRLYEPYLRQFQIPFVKTQWHRYAGDLNRLPDDVDCEAVVGNPQPPGTFPRGFHWVYNTHGVKILERPLSLEVHQQIVRRVYEPFHLDLKSLAQKLLFSGPVYHLDLHSMPSLGTAQHRDPGEYRKDVVISDCKGKSCSIEFRELVLNSYQDAGFSVAYNWPYFGGRLTEHYGKPELGHHVLQIELNRALYMDEVTKQLKPEWRELSHKLGGVVERIKNAAAHQSTGL
jgi:N-formylglutamate amidohydrolase